MARLARTGVSGATWWLRTPRADPGARGLFLWWRQTRSRRWLAVLDGMTLAGLVFAFGLFVVRPDATFTDAAIYWRTPLADPYAHPMAGTNYAYLYSPAFLQALAPLRLLPMGGFVALWRACIALALALEAGPFTLPLLFTLPVSGDLFAANVNILLGAALLLGLRYPAAWSFIALTKVTPGVVLLWFAVRREWRAFATACAATAVIVAVSLVLTPGAWTSWIAVLVDNAGRSGASLKGANVPVSLVLRLPASALLVVWGARRDKRWTLPLAACLALPILWTAGFGVLVAGIPLVQDWTRAPEAPGIARALRA